MPTLGDLVINMRANNRDFNRGMQQSQTRAQRFSKFMKVGMAAGVAAGAAAAVRSIGFIKDSMSDLDKIAKLSRSSGLDGSFIQAFGFAAEQTGGSMSEAQDAIKQFTRRLGDAADGSGAAADKLAQIGLSVDDLMQMSPEQQILTVADAIASLGTEAERADAMQQLFGRSSQNMINLFATGSSGIRTLTDEYRSFGNQLTQTDLRAIEDANDAVNRLQTQASIFGQKLVVELAPAIEKFADRLSTLNTNAGDVVDTLGELFELSTQGSFEAMGQAMDLMAEPPGPPSMPVRTGLPNGFDSVADLDKAAEQEKKRGEQAKERTKEAERLKKVNEDLARARQDAADRLAVLQGTATDDDIAVRDFAVSGANTQELEEYRRLLEQIREQERILDMQRRAQKDQEDADRKRTQNTMDFMRAMAEAGEEAKILRGEMTRIDQQIADWRAQGISEDLLAVYRKQLEENERIRKEQEDAEKRKRMADQPERLIGADAQRGTVEAFKLLIGPQRRNPQLDEAKKHTGFLKSVDKKLDNLPTGFDFELQEAVGGGE